MRFPYLALLALALIPPTASHSQSPEPISRALPDDVAVTRDLVYAAYGERRLSLDLYMPSRRDDGLLPTIVVIRGNGWLSGDKEHFGPIAAALAKRGLAAVSIEFRASGEATFPAAVQDTKAATRWVRANATRYQLDPNAIGAIGGSSGAHLAVYLGVTGDDRQLEGDGGNRGVSSAVSAVVGLATPTDLGSIEHPGGVTMVTAFLGAAYEEDASLWERASPARHVDPSSPPLLLMHSENDAVVPYEQSLHLARQYEAAGVPVEVVLIPDAPHAFWRFTEWFDDTMDRAAAFFLGHLDGGD